MVARGTVEETSTSPSRPSAFPSRCTGSRARASRSRPQIVLLVILDPRGCRAARTARPANPRSGIDRHAEDGDIGLEVLAARHVGRRYEVRTPAKSSAGVRAPGRAPRGIAGILRPRAGIREAERREPPPAGNVVAPSAPDIHRGSPRREGVSRACRMPAAIRQSSSAGGRARAPAPIREVLSHSRDPGSLFASCG